nr:MAG TPA: hypothetical protein [Caudoviricetes sp.]
MVVSFFILTFASGMMTLQLSHLRLSTIGI